MLQIIKTRFAARNTKLGYLAKGKAKASNKVNGTVFRCFYLLLEALLCNHGNVHSFTVTLATSHPGADLCGTGSSTRAADSANTVPIPAVLI